MSFLQAIGRVVVTVLMAGGVALILRTFALRIAGIESAGLGKARNMFGASVGGLTSDGVADDAEEAIGSDLDDEVTDRPYTRRHRIVDIIALVAFGLLLIYFFGDRTERFVNSSDVDKAASTLWGVVLGVSASAALFIGANILFNQASVNYVRFKTLLGVIIGFVTFGLLDGNRLIQHVAGRDTVANALHDVVNFNGLTLLATSIIIGAAIFSVYGFAYGTPKDLPMRYATILASVGALAGAIWGLFFAERIPVDTAIGIVWTPLLGAVLVGALGFALSKLDQPVRLVVGAAGGAGIGALLGAFLFRAVTPRMEVPSFLLWTAVFAALGIAIAYGRENLGRPGGGALTGIGLGAVLGVVISVSTGQSIADTVAGIAMLAIVGAALSVFANNLLNGALSGSLVGWLIGSFFVTTVGGPKIEAIAACAVAGALAGARFGAPARPNQVQRTNIENSSRGPIFLAPAGFVIMTGLVIPLIRTIYLSFTDTVRREGVRGRFTEWVGLEQYERIFLTNPSSFDVSDWPNMFTRAPFELGLLLLIVSLAVAVFVGRDSGVSAKRAGWILPGVGVLSLIAAVFQIRLISSIGSESAQAGAVDAASVPIWRYLYVALFLVAGVALIASRFVNVGALTGASVGDIRMPLDFTGGHSGLAAVAVFLVATAVFASLRGTIFNSLWWVFTVTLLSTVFGLAIAALADRANYENVAKSIIFMPLAISFVGAGIIWRFMFIARPQGQPQTGAINWTWLKIGDLSASGFRWLGVAVLLALVAGAVFMAYTGVVSRASGLAGTGVTLALPLLWLAWRLGAGRLGGTGAAVQDRTLFFLSDDLPYNNFWLMLVLIWIQTGFAMVIFSAAIKAVPAEFIEAAKVDGATDSNIFWRIIVPQILPTVGVVVTTLVVTVLKVFDIVRVMTNGNFGTQVIANEMFVQTFSNRETGLGSALAVILFVAVVPVVFVNVRRLQHEEF